MHRLRPDVPVWRRWAAPAASFLLLAVGLVVLTGKVFDVAAVTDMPPGG